VEACSYKTSVSQVRMLLDYADRLKVVDSPPLPHRPVRIQSLKITVFWGVTLCNLVQILCPASIGNNSVSEDYCLLEYNAV
jgi:hypothetical protein